MTYNVFGGTLKLAQPTNYTERPALYTTQCRWAWRSTSRGSVCSSWNLLREQLRHPTVMYDADI